jgi:hypothetical protein
MGDKFSGQAKQQGGRDLRPCIPCRAAGACLDERGTIGRSPKTAQLAGVAHSPAAQCGSVKGDQQGYTELSQRGQAFLHYSGTWCMH